MKRLPDTRGLGDKEREALSLMLEASGRVVSIEAISRRLWPHSPQIEAKRVRNLIYRLRRKRRDIEIEAIVNEGYILVSGRN